jgi:hypothetical protein
VDRLHRFPFIEFDAPTVWGTSSYHDALSATIFWVPLETITIHPNAVAQRKRRHVHAFIRVPATVTV